MRLWTARLSKVDHVRAAREPKSSLSIHNESKATPREKISMLLLKLSFVEEIKAKAITIIHHLVMGKRQRLAAEQVE